MSPESCGSERGVCIFNIMGSEVCGKPTQEVYDKIFLNNIRIHSVEKLPSRIG